MGAGGPPPPPPPVMGAGVKTLKMIQEEKKLQILNASKDWQAFFVDVVKVVYKMPGLDVSDKKNLFEAIVVLWTKKVFDVSSNLSEEPLTLDDLEKIAQDAVENPEKALEDSKKYRPKKGNYVIKKKEQKVIVN